MKYRIILFSLILSFAYVGAFTNCGGKGSSVDLTGETSTLNNNNQANDDTTDNANFTSETVEDDEVVQTDDAGTEGDTNEDHVVDAPVMGYVTETLVYIDCCVADATDLDLDGDTDECTRTTAGDPALDYVALSCSQGSNTIEYHYYCTSSTDTESNEIFIVSRDTDDDPVVTDELFQTILVTCETAEDGTSSLFEEDYIVS